MTPSSERPSLRSPRPDVRLQTAIFLCSALAILLIFLSLFIQAPLFYDEANYLVLSEAIRLTGYPIWFWHPDSPGLFVNSPPAILYLMSALTDRISSDVVVLRLFFVALFAVPLLLVIPLYALRTDYSSLIPSSVAALFAACSGIFLSESIQLRFDLPLAYLTLLTLVLWIDAETRGWSWLSLSVLFTLSVLAYLTKFQAVCLTGALGVYVLFAFAWSGRAAVLWTAVLVHIAAVAVAIVCLAVWASFAPDRSNALTHAMAWNVSGRILHGYDLKNLVQLFKVLQQIVIIVVVPLTVFILASALGRIDWENDRLLQICVSLTAVVIAFNLAVFDLPGAGSYYMIQALIPLGFILGRSIQALSGDLKWRGSATWAALSILILYGAMNTPPVTRLVQPDFNKAIANQLKRVLDPEDLLLLGSAFQSRDIPYLLGRADRYGYLLMMSPAAAENLLTRSSPNRVGALVLPEKDVDRLTSSMEWSNVADIIERDYIRSSKFGTFTQVIYLRRKRETVD